MRRSLTLAGLAVGLLWLAPATAVATPTEACSPTPKLASSFCATLDLALGAPGSSLIAAAPFNANVSLSNSSTGFGSDQNRWLQSVTLRIGDAAQASPPSLTRSEQLPNGLLLAGGGSCTAPTYADCAGGGGTLVATVACCGSTGGSFGIAKVTNVNPAGAGNYAHLRITIKSCVNALGSCFEAPDQIQDLVLPEPAGDAAPPTEFILLTRGSFASPAGNVDFSVSQFALHLLGASAQLETGPADRTYTILSSPRDCGTFTGTSAFTSGDARIVSIPVSTTVTGCPAAGVSHSVDDFEATLEGSGSVSPVAGRSITQYLWEFGDGTSDSTSTPTVTHSYGPGDHMATLQVVDSAGARSSILAEPVAGSRTSVKAKAKRGKARVKGNVVPARQGERVAVELQRGKKGAFVKVAAKLAKLKAGGNYKVSFKLPKAKKCRVVATFGSDELVASSATKTFAC